MSRTLRTAAALGTAALCVSLAACNSGRRQRRGRQRPGDQPRRPRPQARVERRRKTSAHPDGPADADRSVRARQEGRRHAGRDRQARDRDQGQVPAGPVRADRQAARLHRAGRAEHPQGPARAREGRRAAGARQRRRHQGVLRQEPRGVRQARAGPRAPHPGRRRGDREAGARASSRPAATGTRWRNSTRPIRLPRTRAASSATSAAARWCRSSRTPRSARRSAQIVGPGEVAVRLPHHPGRGQEARPRRRRSRARTIRSADAAHAAAAEPGRAPLFVQQLRSTAKIEVYDDRYKDAFPPAAVPRRRSRRGAAAARRPRAPHRPRPRAVAGSEPRSNTTRGGSRNDPASRTFRGHRDPHRRPGTGRSGPAHAGQPRVAARRRPRGDRARAARSWCAFSRATASRSSAR